MKTKQARKDPYDGKQFNRIREGIFKMSYPEFGFLFGVHKNTIARKCRGEVPVSEPESKLLDRFIRELDEGKIHVGSLG